MIMIMMIVFFCFFFVIGPIISFDTWIDNCNLVSISILVKIRVIYTFVGSGVNKKY
jgi:hypothetical protein